MAVLAAEDALAIERLYARYSSAIGEGDAAAWTDCFAPDGRFSNARGSYRGSAELAAYAEGWIGDGGVRYWINNLVVEPAGSGAAGSCYLAIIEAGTRPGIELTGVYSDTLVRLGGGWKFATRRAARD